MKPREKKVLILAYYFPPLGMGGVQRVTKFVKYLPLFGWKPHVLTVKEVEYLAQDPSLLKDILPAARITRTGSFDPLRVWFVLKNILKKRRATDKYEFEPRGLIKAYNIRTSRFLSWLYFPDNKVGWIPFALMRGLLLCRREKFDLIFSTSPPPSLHLTGYLLKLLTGIPWIADFRDPWAGYKFEIFPTPLHLFLKKRMEKLIIDQADRVITANPAITRELETRYPYARNICPVSQGYDEEDFETYRSGLSDVFTIGYLGTFSPDCDPEPFLAALRQSIDRGRIPGDRVKFVHIGLPVGIDLGRLIEKYNLKEVVELKGYLSHPESLNQMSKVSLLLLITSAHPLIFPAKIFEYLRLKKPILGILPQKSEAARFLTEMKMGKVISPEDKEGIGEALLSYFSDHHSGKATSDVEEDQIKRFERKSLTFRLSSILDKVIGI